MSNSTCRALLAIGIGVMSLAAVMSPANTARASESRFAIELEAGATWQKSNDVEIPNDGTATRFSLKDLVGEGPWPAARIYFTWDINDRHGLRALVAPLSYTEQGQFDTPVRFAGADYLAGTPTEATYKFNSYRIGYRYSFFRGTHWTWRVGFTAKIRDAKIELQQGATTSRDTDLGFVPLLHISGDWRFAEQWLLLLDIEGLAGGPGRAEDVSLKVGYDISRSWRLTGGYRLVEGGADVEQVYNFAWFNFAVVSGVYRF